MAGLAATIRRDARHQLDGPQYSASKPLSPLRFAQLVVSPEFSLVVAFRLYSTLYQRGFRHPAYLLYVATKWVFQCDLAMEARIGPGLRLGHAQDLVIGSACVLGADCHLFNGVTLGNRWSGEGNRQPVLGDRVLVGAGAKLLGPIEVGDDARIGANAVVLESVPPGATAAGNPASVVRR